MEMLELAHGAHNREGGEIFVDEFLNLPNDVKDEEKEAIEFSGVDDAAGVISTDSSSVVTAVDSCTSSLSGYEHFSSDFARRSISDVSYSGADLCEPYDQLAELEWMSNIVQESDSFSSDELQKLHLITGFKPLSPSSSNSRKQPFTTEAEETAEPPPGFFNPETPVPGKARSKRSRIAPCNWSSRLLVLSEPPSDTSPASSESSANHSALVGVAQKTPKLAKKKDPSHGPNYAASDGRKCLHCATDKTPQWRTGPLGPKTLCNACGVRYKSGRLVPEYRPAASPTFVLSKHSNSHRKVLELRRQKEVQTQQQQQHQSYLHAGGAVFDASGGDDFLIHHHIGPDFRQLI